MSQKNRNKSRGISIHVIHLAMILCAVVIAVLLVFSTYQSSGVFSSLSQETGNYISRQKAAHDLMEASDYLTENVQHFTLSGDMTYLNNYFEEAFNSRRREAALLSMSEGGADPILVQQLQEAMDKSMELMYREYYAMKLVIAAREIREYPETLKGVELTEEDAFLPAEEKLTLARDMVMGTEYYASKEIIRSRLKNDLDMLDQQMTQTRQETSTRMMGELSTVRIAIIALTVVLILLIGLTVRLGTLPLLKALESIRNREEIPVTGSREFRQLAEHYNEMYQTLQVPEDAGEEPSDS